LELLRTRLSPNYLWSAAGQSFTPKIHGMFSHAVQQLKQLKGIGDILEDNLENPHQVSKRLPINQVE
jgi:hypothetical protein